MKLVFVTGNAIRRVNIIGRTITFIAVEVGFQPIVLDLDRIEEPSMKVKMKKMKMTDQDIKSLKEIAGLGTEEEIARDIIIDFQKTGWRLLNKIQ